MHFYIYGLRNQRRALNDNERTEKILRFIYRNKQKQKLLIRPLFERRVDAEYDCEGTMAFNFGVSCGLHFQFITFKTHQN